jgi:hypothetical protein
MARRQRLLDPAHLGTLSPLPHRAKPTLAHTLRDVSALFAASRLYGKPLCISGDDAGDNFERLAVASEDWWKLGVTYPRTDAPVVGASIPHERRILLVSEHRLGSDR